MVFIFPANEEAEGSHFKDTVEIQVTSEMEFHDIVL
jgi:hypothetical protein